MRADASPPGPPGLGRVLWAQLRRSPGHAAAGLLAAALAAAALVGALGLLLAMGRTLERGLTTLGADMVLTLPGHEQQVMRWLATGDAAPVPAAIDAAEWQRAIAGAELLGVKAVEAVDLSRGGAGEPAGERASVLVMRLEFWASAPMIRATLAQVLPEAVAVVGEQATRHVLTDLQPLVRHLGRAAAVAALGAALLSGLLAAIRVGERRAELGMLRAMGATRSYLLVLTVGESVAVALPGGLAGGLLATVVLRLLPATAALVRHLGAGPLLGLLALACAATTAAGALAALPPALQAAWLDPLDAVRRHR
ncbi:MAG: FtsX-like permease family protein [Symbiobacterium sp.]|uniref:FtsX-like permease family protein n=1 Tax=Symbiobacterium sp. TaxID=1971213 RepID=UPI0034638FE2